MAGLSLMAYALGLPGFMLVKILAPAFYSRKDTKTPVRIAVIALVTNMTLNLVFVVPMVMLEIPGPHAGLALATSIAAWVNASLLFVMLYRKKGLPATGRLAQAVYANGPGRCCPRCFAAVRHAAHTGMAGLDGRVPGCRPVCLGACRCSDLFSHPAVAGLAPETSLEACWVGAVDRISLRSIRATVTIM